MYSFLLRKNPFFLTSGGWTSMKTDKEEKNCLKYKKFSKWDAIVKSPNV
jgi:hypothetical protein